MSQSDKRTGNVNVTIGGSVSGQVAVGDDIRQTQTIVGGDGPVTAADLDALRALLADLRAQVERAAPDTERAAALERVGELEEAITAEQPDLSVMEYVKGWFGKNLPAVAGTVASVVVHPIVGKVVGAAGDALAAEFSRRFGTKG